MMLIGILNLYRKAVFPGRTEKIKLCFPLDSHKLIPPISPPPSRAPSRIGRLVGPCLRIPETNMRRFDTSLQPRSPLPLKHSFFLVAQELQGMIEPDPPEFRTVRQRQRRPRSISISVQPLDDDFQPDGDQFWVVSRDISTKGLGLICHEAIAHGFVRIGLMNEAVTVIGNVRHSTSIGHQYPLFLVGVEFVNEIDLG